MHKCGSASFRRYIAGILAHSKGKSLGIFHDTEVTEQELERREQRDRNMGVERVTAFGMTIPTLKKGKRRLAFSQGSSISPAPVQKYLHHSFQDTYTEVKVSEEKVDTGPLTSVHSLH